MARTTECESDPGIQWNSTEKGLEILSFWKGTDSFKSDLKAGDIITKVDNLSVKNSIFSNYLLSKKLCSILEKNSKVYLTVKSKGEKFIKVIGVTPVNFIIGVGTG